jgi:hypothetical protein
MHLPTCKNSQLQPRKQQQFLAKDFMRAILNMLIARPTITQRAAAGWTSTYQPLNAIIQIAGRAHSYLPNAQERFKGQL